MNRPAYLDAEECLLACEGMKDPPPVADAVLALARTVLAVAEAINRSHQEGSR